MKWVCMATLISLVALAFFIGFQLLTDTRETLAAYLGVQVFPGAIGAWQLGLILAVNAVTVLFMSAALFALWEMFSEFSEGNILAMPPARNMRKAGQHFVWTAAWGFVAQPLTVLLATIGNPPGERQLSIALGSHMLFPLLLAGVLVCVGHVLMEAIRIDRENKSFV